MNHQAPGFSRIDLPVSGLSDSAPSARGTVRVAPRVLIELIELTVLDVSGVTGFHNRHRMERILPRAHESSSSTGAGRDIEARGIGIHLEAEHIDADVAITVAQDTSMAEVSEAIRRQVGIAVNRMLGLDVRSVNVYIAGVRPYTEE